MSRKLSIRLDFNNRLQRDLKKSTLFSAQALLVDSTIKNSVKSKQFPSKLSVYPTRGMCVFTGRSRAIHNKFKLSRMTLKYASLNEWINGVTKYTW